jgi:lipoprotein-anchoring transpeptidase ErfK/SrfK
MQRIRPKKIRILGTIVLLAAITGTGAFAYAGRGGVDDTTALNDPTLQLLADLSDRILTAQDSSGDTKQFQIAVGTAEYPTPRGSFLIRKIVWNPSWTPPPNSEWARNKTAKEPGDPGNPMKMVKIFFKEPDYYIHGTDQMESLGSAASHGCLRMDPVEAAELAQYVMTHGGQPVGPGWIERILTFRSKEKVVYLKHPVPITIAD